MVKFSIYKCLYLLAVSVLLCSRLSHALTLRQPEADVALSSTDLVPFNALSASDEALLYERLPGLPQLRIQSNTQGLAAAIIGGLFAGVVARCSVGTGIECYIGLLATALFGYFNIYLYRGSVTAHSGAEKPFEMTFRIGGGSNMPEEVLRQQLGADFESHPYLQESLDLLRPLEPMYMTLKDHDTNTSSVTVFKNETSTPDWLSGMAQNEKEYNVVSMQYVWLGEVRSNFNEFDRSRDSIDKLVKEIATFLNTNHYAKSCLAFDTDNRSPPQVNYGTLYINEGGSVDRVCDAPNQGVTKNS